MKIEAKHLAWIFEAAGEHFSEKIAELETEIMRHEHFINVGQPLVRHNIAPKTRMERHDEAVEALGQYRALTVFCREVRIKCADKSSEDFARAFKGQFKV